MAAIVTRAPLRISLGGGGTDLPSWYRSEGGLVVSAAIDRHVVVSLTAGRRNGYLLKHLEWEEAADPATIRHPILRAALSRHWDGRGVELASVADVPPGTGLGSSGAYAVCVLKALALASGSDVEPAQLAEAACVLEIEELGRRVGKQDQYASAFGGLHAYAFRPDDGVDARRIALDPELRRVFRDELLLFFTGRDRSASDLLAHQVDRTLAGDAAARRNLERAGELARASLAALEAGDVERLTQVLDEQWEVKRDRAPGAVTAEIEELRDVARRSGARGAALMGAGGGGYLLVHAPDPEATRRAMAEAGAPELGFDLDEQGCVALAPAA